MNPKKWLTCLLFGHESDRTRGYYDEPAKGAVCTGCGKELGDYPLTTRS